MSEGRGSYQRVENEKLSGVNVRHVGVNNGASGGQVAGRGNQRRISARPSSSALLQAKIRAQKSRRAGGDEVTFVGVTDHLEAARESKGNIRKSTGVIHDERLMEHKCLWDDEFPERPERFSVVVQRCQRLGLLDRCTQLDARLATNEELVKIHTPGHVQTLSSISAKGKVDPDSLEEASSHFDSVYFHHQTSDVAKLAAGCSIELVNAILDGRIGNGMAIVRPPGHHAMEGEYCGYSFYNNVAIAAKIALEKWKLTRILIVDFDVHHGQGTQQAFYNDPRVLYFSTHRYEHGSFWPHLEESNFNFIGDGPGTGFNVNIPLNSKGLGNSDFLSAWHNILLPLAYEFNPELVLVSAGYDSALGDEKGEMELEPRCYPHLIWPLLGLAGGKVGVVLEGGYCLQSLAEGAALTLRCLLGDHCPSIAPTIQPNPILADTILDSAYMLQQQWKNLSNVRYLTQAEIKSSNEEDEDTQERVHWPIAKYTWTLPKPERFETRDCYPVQNQVTKERTKTQLDEQTASTSLALASQRVCLVYNEIMLKHQSTSQGGHPEKPERISSIFNLHVEYELLDRVTKLDGRNATEDELKLIHTEEHVEKMKGINVMSTEDLEKFQKNLTSVYFHPSTYESAVFSAGSVLQVTENVLSGKSQSGVAIVRPPGHHAEKTEACGFCIFNNVAIAGKFAVEKFGLERVLILDWDVHHGNGIQRVFQDDPRVLYISIHRYDNGSFFPCLDDADHSFVGTGKGKGFTVNVAWNGSGMGDTEYIAAFHKILLPIAYQFAPQLVLVSAGFDAAKGDPLGGCKVTPECYGHMTHLLSSLANGKVIVALEGGYNLASISYSMTQCTKALLGDPLPPLNMNKTILPSAVTSMRNTLEAHAQYWPTVQPFLRTLPTFDDALVPLGKYSETRSNGISLKNLQIS